eukprot:760031-Hanusia_phi.AAC.5
MAREVARARRKDVGSEEGTEDAVPKEGMSRSKRKMSNKAKGSKPRKQQRSSKCQVQPRSLWKSSTNSQWKRGMKEDEDGARYEGRFKDGVLVSTRRPRCCPSETIAGWTWNHLLPGWWLAAGDLERGTDGGSRPGVEHAPGGLLMYEGEFKVTDTGPAHRLCLGLTVVLQRAGNVGRRPNIGTQMENPGFKEWCQLLRRTSGRLNDICPVAAWRHGGCEVLRRDSR